ncbi:MAG: hypothetical protein ACRC2O_14895 [Chitinophagaceae bacterium]
MYMNNNAEIKLPLQNINELLRSPVSIYLKSALITDAEEFIIEEAEALPAKALININVHLALSEIKHKDDIAPAIHRHFSYRKEQSQKEYKRIFKYGWRILLIALGLLAFIFIITEIAFYYMPDNKPVLFIHESFIILSWVALWRPLELLMYEWYPVKTDIDLYTRLEKCTVQVILDES